METLFVGKNLIFLPEVPSTNSYATHLLKNVNLAEGSVVHTGHQTHGKGQRGRAWSSEPASNLTVSIVLRPTFLGVKNQFFLYQIAALALYDTIAGLLEPRQFDIKIKWPNDILLCGLKTAGILIENNIANDRINWTVVGIGLNVNQLKFGEDVRATSLRIESGIELSLSLALELLCRNMEKHYLALKNGRFENIRELYLLKLYGLNDRLRFKVGNEEEELTVKGVGETGLLILEDKNSKTLEMDVKQLGWIF